MTYLTQIAYFNSLDLTSFYTSIFWAVFCGAALGLEREFRKKPAGIKTTIFITLGACVFTFVGLLIPEARMIAQIVSGVGFLCAGVIMQNQERLVGLTSASVIWLSASIGILSSLGLHKFAISITGIVILLDFGIDFLKRKIKNS